MIKDIQQSFTFSELGIRGVIVSLDASWQDLLARRSYHDTARSLLGEMCVAACLMGSTIKFDGRLTLQIQSDAALKMGVVQFESQRKYRGMVTLAQNDEVALNKLAKDGRLVISIQTKTKEEKLSDPYQGVVSIGDETLAEVIRSYYVQSEQLNTSLKLYADESRAFGVLLQALPDSLATEDDWQRLKIMLETLSVQEMQRCSIETIVKRLFVEDDVTLYDAKEVQFACRCSEENTLTMLGTLDVVSLQDIIDNESKAVVECDFCGQSYTHSQDTLEALIRDKARPN